MRNVFNLLYKITNKLIDGISIILLVFLVIITTQQVIMRFVFNNPAVWSEEIALLFLIWFGYLGVVIGYRDDRHISITFLIDMMPKKVQKIIEVLGRLLIGTFCLVMINEGIKITKLNTISRLPATGISTSYQSVVLVIAGILMFIDTIIKIYLIIVNDNTRMLTNNTIEIEKED